MAGETDEAYASYRKAVEIDPPYPKAIAKLGQMLVERKEFDEAEAFRRIRAASQKTGRPMRVVSEALIATLGDGA